MTDPRVAALAEALREAGVQPFGWAEQRAAAILAALPADWCGHEATIDALRAEIRDANALYEEMAAERARLRKIEEAARDMADWYGSPPYVYDEDEMAERIAALRAALEEER